MGIMMACASQAIGYNHASFAGTKMKLKIDFGAKRSNTFLSKHPVAKYRDRHKKGGRASLGCQAL